MRTRKIDDDILLQMLRKGKTQAEAAAHFNVSAAAICKRVRRLSSPSPESILEKHGLTDRQGAFVVERVKGKNATQAALCSYEASSTESAKTIGTRLMQQPEIRSAIDELMDFHGLTKSYRIGKLKTHVDNKDPNVSLKALDMSFKLDASYPPQRNVNLNLTVPASPVNFEALFGPRSKGQTEGHGD